MTLIELNNDENKRPGILKIAIAGGYNFNKKDSLIIYEVTGKWLMIKNINKAEKLIIYKDFSMSTNIKFFNIKKARTILLSLIKESIIKNQIQKDAL